MSRSQVLILCTGNSCRSHIAEGLVNHYLDDCWVAHSAGTKPVGYVHPLAIAALAELGIDSSHHRSKSADLFRRASLDLVITVCDDAADNCPVWLGPEQVVHISFSDPAKATGTREEKLAVFRQLRDSMRERILSHLNERSTS